MTIKRVILESPYAGDIDANVQYAQRAARFCAFNGESVIASHLIFPQFLDEQDPKERDMGIEHGLAWLEVADYSVFFTDRGWSRGMMGALGQSVSRGRKFFLRSLDGPVSSPTNLQLLDLSRTFTGDLMWNCDVEAGKRK